MLTHTRPRLLHITSLKRSIHLHRNTPFPIRPSSLAQTPLPPRQHRQRRIHDQSLRPPRIRASRRNLPRRRNALGPLIPPNRLTQLRRHAPPRRKRRQHKSRHVGGRHLRLRLQQDRPKKHNHRKHPRQSLPHQATSRARGRRPRRHEPPPPQQPRSNRRLPTLPSKRGNSHPLIIKIRITKPSASKRRPRLTIPPPRRPRPHANHLRRKPHILLPIRHIPVPPLRHLKQHRATSLPARRETLLRTHLLRRVLHRRTLADHGDVILCHQVLEQRD